MYTPYVSASEYYLTRNKLPAEEVTKYLIKASRHIDTLTFNRIQHFGWDRLTDFQQGMIYEVICEHAEFLYDNADAIDSIISSYSINGVSMEFGTGFNVHIEGGLPIKSELYSMLEQTGLCCRLAR